MAGPGAAMAMALALVGRQSGREGRNPTFVGGGGVQECLATLVLRDHTTWNWSPPAKVPIDSPPSAELSARVARWTFWTWFREPLDIISIVCFLLALHWLKRSS
jgi:hypothetical protein